MTETTRVGFALLGALLLAGAAPAEEMKGMEMPRSAVAKPAAGVRTPADAAYEAAMQGMMKDMAVKPTGDADRDFVDMMTPHHQGAIDMARVELRYGKDPMLRKLATDIVAAQEREIAAMRAWQAAHAR